jgi:RNA polymerase sigma-70 factor (ECF subfamily)
MAEVDEATFEELYEYYLLRLFSYMIYRVGDRQLAEDLTATVFEKALTRIATYRRDRGAFSTWLFTIARNVIVDHLRQQARAEMVNLDDLRAMAAPGTPETEYLRQEELASLYTGLNSLAEREKQIIALKFAAELPNTRIAQVVGLSAENVGVILYRAIGKLRKRLEENEQ